ncbi:hypothetical protein ACVIJ6_007049 [Bradyrhizobium sp. USDA 4369]
MVLTLIRDLPGDRLTCPRRLADHHRRLGLSTGRPGPHDFTSALRRSSARPSPAAAARVHRIPHPTSVTIAIRPLGGTEWAEDRGDLGRAPNDLCFSEYLDGFSEIGVIWATGTRGVELELRCRCGASGWPILRCHPCERRDPYSAAVVVKQGLSDISSKQHLPDFMGPGSARACPTTLRVAGSTLIRDNSGGLGEGVVLGVRRTRAISTHDAGSSGGSAEGVSRRP